MHGSEVVELRMELVCGVDKADEPGGMAAAFQELENHAENIMFVARVAAFGKMVDFVVRQGEGEAKVSKEYQRLDSFAVKASKELSGFGLEENTVKVVETPPRTLGAYIE